MEEMRILSDNNIADFVKNFLLAGSIDPPTRDLNQ